MLDVRVNDARLLVTPSHRIVIPGDAVTSHEMRAGDLQTGDSVMVADNTDNKSMEITSIRKVREGSTVFALLLIQRMSKDMETTISTTNALSKLLLLSLLLIPEQANGFLSSTEMLTCKCWEELLPALSRLVVAYLPSFKCYFPPTTLK